MSVEETYGDYGYAPNAPKDRRNKAAERARKALGVLYHPVRLAKDADEMEKELDALRQTYSGSPQPAHWVVYCRIVWYLWRLRQK
jgi:hypothetical protein